MSYMQDLEARLREITLKQLLTGITEEDRALIIREVKKIALESYRNGQKAGIAPGKKAQPAKASTAKAPAGK